MVKQIMSIYKIMLTDYKCKSLDKYTAWPTDIVIYLSILGMCLVPDSIQ